MPCKDMNMRNISVYIIKTYAPKMEEKRPIIFRAKNI